MHEGCDRGGYYEQAQFAEEYGSPLCIVKLGCWGPVVQCNVGKRGWMAGLGGCPNVGGICIGCTMPGFPDKFMPFMNQPPGSLLSSAAVQTYGRAIHALRRFTQASLNKEPSWRQRRQPPANHNGLGTSLMAAEARCANRSQAEAVRSLTPAQTCPGSPKQNLSFSISPASLPTRPQTPTPSTITFNGQESASDARAPNPEAKYRALLEQIPAVVFMASLDRGISEAYVSPQIEAALGYSREEWLEDPVRWYERIHPDDKQRWSLEAAEMFLSGKPLRSAYRVIARDGRVIWFHCDARMMRWEDGRPWCIHGVAFDISDIKRIEEELQEERNFVSAILDTVGALVVVLDSEGHILRFNPACELTTGYSMEEVQGKCVWDLFLLPEETDRFRAMFEVLRTDLLPQDYQTHWVTRHGDKRLIAWSSTLLPGNGETARYIIATGIDITERKHLEKAILDISAREQRRIGQDLHDGLGQHLTGIAFMAKVHEAKLAEQKRSETEDAAKIVKLVNEAIHKTRELARGLLPVRF